MKHLEFPAILTVSSFLLKKHFTKRKCSKTQFIGNKATNFNGQIGYNPLTFPSTGPKKQAPRAGIATPKGAGCPKPPVTGKNGNTFVGAGTAVYSPEYFFIR